jgi:hypothetical protein
MLLKKDLFEKIKGMIGTKPDVGDSFQSRKNDDGEFGRRLEEALGIKENNSQNADVPCFDGDVELKSHNVDSTCRTSVMTKEPTWNKSEGFSTIHEVVKTFATSDFDGTKRCNTTITSTPNNKGLSIDVNENDRKVKIVDSNQKTVGSWSFDQLEDKLNQKCGDSVIVVSRNEEGIILDADFYSGGDFDSMKEMLRDGRMVVEIRAKTGATKKNRGTVFRTSQKHMPDLFSGILL